MVQIPINNQLPGAQCQRPRKYAKAGVASVQPVILGLKNTNIIRRIIKFIPKTVVK